MNKEKRPYEAPVLTVVSFKMEKGYAGSGGLRNYRLINDAWGLGGIGQGSISDYNIINDAWGLDGFGRGSVSDYNVINDSWGL